MLAWGAGDPAVAFHPYWKNSDAVEVDGQGGDALVSFYKKDGKLLLIASNRTTQDKDIAITLDLKALGLGPEPKVKHCDTGYTPAEGEDMMKRGEMNETIDKAGDELMDGVAADEDDGLGDDVVDAIEDQFDLEDHTEAISLRLKGNVLTVPVRAHDFRMVTIE